MFRRFVKGLASIYYTSSKTKLELMISDIESQLPNLKANYEKIKHEKLKLTIDDYEKKLTNYKKKLAKLLEKQNG